MITAKEVKDSLNISGKDAQIETLIPLVYDMLELNYVGWTDIHVINIIGYQIKNEPGLQSISVARYSASFADSLPSHLLAGLRKKGVFL